MITLTAKATDTTKDVAEAVKKANFKSLGHAVGGIAKTAKKSIVKSDEPSPEGTPPHTRATKGKNLRGAIRFAVGKEEAVAGPMASVIGEVGAAHEFGEIYKGQDFDIRAFMGPALEKNEDRLAKEWYGSVR